MRNVYSLDRFLMMHFVTKTTPIIIINYIVNAEVLHRLTEND